MEQLALARIKYNRKTANNNKIRLTYKLQTSCSSFSIDHCTRMVHCIAIISYTGWLAAWMDGWLVHWYNILLFGLLFFFFCCRVVVGFFFLFSGAFVFIFSYFVFFSKMHNHLLGTTRIQIKIIISISLALHMDFIVRVNKTDAF